MSDTGPVPFQHPTTEATAAPFLIGEGRDPTAVMGRRIGAYVLDGLIPLVAGLLVILAFGDVTRIDGVRTCRGVSGACGQFNDSVVTARGWAVAAAWLLPLLYTVVFSWIVQGRTGATPGKAVFGLRVVDAAGGGPGLTKAFLRSILLVVDTIGCCLPIVGLVTALASKGHRRVGDMVAGTFVVDRSDTGRPIVLPTTGAPPGAAVAVAPIGPPATGYGPTPAPYAQTSAPPPYPQGPPARTSTPAAPPPPPARPQSPPPPPAPPAPQWDPARGTYVLWDPTRGRWMAFDQRAQRWYDI